MSKGLLAATGSPACYSAYMGGLEEGGGVFREVILSGEILGIRLILVGCEGNHIVERSYFHRSQLSWNGLSPLCLQDNTGLTEAASILLAIE